MRKGNFFKQTLDIMLKIFLAFTIVFVLYFTTKLINNFAYDYFVFPLVAITIIFMCGVNVGRSLEKLKTNESVGYFTKKSSKKEDYNDFGEKTEFIVNENIRISTNKKVLKEVQEGDKVHIKVTNYNDIYKDEESE